MTLENLITIYADVNDIDEMEWPGYIEAEIKRGNIDMSDLLEAYLTDEGIIGYTEDILDVIRTCKKHNIGWLDI